MTDKWEPLDDSLITEDICMQCGRCCKMTMTENRFHKRSTADDTDRGPYMQAMFALNPKAKVVVKNNTIDVITHCSHLQPDLKCGIYKDRPKICIDYNCFTWANGKKQLPQHYDFVKNLIDVKKKLGDLKDGTDIS